MKPDLENLKEYTQKNSLTQEEKFAMFENIRTYSNTHPIKTPYYSVFFKHSLAYTSMLALIIGTSATSFAAEGALPGDILYPVKTEINEVVAEKLAFTKTQKAKVAIKLVDKRMEELEKLIVEKEHTPEKIDVIVEKLEEHKEEIEQITNDIEPTNENNEETREIYATLDSTVDAHIEVLKEITNAEEDYSTAAITTALSAIDIATTSPAIEKPVTTIDSTSTEEIEILQNTYDEIVDFSTTVEPVLNTMRKKIKDEDSKESLEIKKETKKIILEKAEKELEIDIEEIKELHI